MNDRDLEKTLVCSALGAVKPWKSSDAKYPVSIQRMSDTQAQIDKCLSCPKYACTNCLHGRRAKKSVSKKMIPLQTSCAET